MYKKFTIMILGVAIITICYAWIRFTHVGLDTVSVSLFFILSFVLFLLTLRILGIKRLILRICLAGLLAIVVIASIEIVALLQENQVRRKYPEPCSFERSPQIPRFTAFKMIIMQCRKDGIWGARTD